MTDGDIQIKAKGFSAVAQLNGGMVVARLDGTADLSVKTLLDEFLGQVHRHAQAEHPPEVVLDLTNVAFMNSSCLKSVCTWIRAVGELPAVDQYRIIMVSNPAVHWQRRSVPIMASLAADRVTVRV